jgi:hypothetical protein
MSDVSYESFLIEVLPYVPSAPSVVAVQAIRNTCIEFCTETRYLQVDMDPVTAIINQSHYDLEVDGDYVVVDVMQAWYGASLLVPKAPEQLAQIYRNTDWRTVTGNPYYYFRERATQVTLVPKPQLTERNKINLRVAIAPTRSSTTVDGEIYERFLEQIAMGARARLYNMVGQTFADANLGALYGKRFNDAMAEARTRVYKGLTRASVNLEFQRWA